MQLVAHNLGRARYRPMDQTFTLICTCGQRIDGASRLEAETRADAHRAIYEPVAAGERP